MNIWIEIFGYIGSALVVVSLLMASIVKLRVISTIGSAISGTYALIIGSIPLVVMNLCLVVINVYFLIKLFRPEKHFDLIKNNTDDALLSYFVSRHYDDIKAYFPHFDRENMGQRAYTVCCNGLPAGLFLANETEDGTLDIIIDYSTPRYRDCSVASYLYSKLPKQGVNKLTFSAPDCPNHINYLKKMGYTKANGIYQKTL